MEGINLTRKMIMGRSSILVVEDSDDDFEVLKRVTAKLNIPNPVFRCRSGNEAWQFLMEVDIRHQKRSGPVVILLDLSMPGLDGRKLLAMIKSNEHLKHIPVIILTSSVNGTDVESCYRFGANSYLQKPMDFDDYLDLMKSFKEFWLSHCVFPLN